MRPGFRCHHKIQPLPLRFLFIARQNLHLVSTRQFMAHRHQLMIHFRSDTGISDFSMDIISKIKCRSSLRQGTHISFRRKYPDFLCE